MQLPGLNKYTALIIVLIILIVCYFGYTYSRKEKVTSAKKKSRKGKAIGKRKVTSHKLSRKDEIKKGKEEDDDEDESEVNDDEKSDAEELYNLVHQSMCNGMSLEEFLEITGDLGNNFIYIELKQLYNMALQKKMDPSNSISVDDYINILVRNNSE